MAQWIDTVGTHDFQRGMHRVVELEDVCLLLVNIDGEFYAIENICSHDGGELSEGVIDGDEITCPRHGARFCLKTGKVLSAPAFEDIESYPVRVIDDMVQVFDEEK